MESRVSLTERLEQAKASSPVFLNAFELFIDDYFNAVAELTGKPCFREVYRKIIRPFHARQDHVCVLPEIVFYSRDLPQKERRELLYRILIEPFVWMEGPRPV